MKIDQPSSDLFIHVVGWDRFQHGSTRENPWIKNYVSQLHKDEYLGLSFHLRGVLHSLRLRYAASDRQLRHNTATLKRQLGQRVTTRDIESLVQAGFIEVRASIVLAQSRVEESREKNLRGAVAPVLDGQALVAHLVNEAVRLNRTLPARSKGHAASLIKALLNDGMPTPVMRLALTQVLERGRPFAALPDIAREIQATGAPDEDERPTTGTYALMPLAE